MRFGSKLIRDNPCLRQIEKIENFYNLATQETIPEIDEKIKDLEKQITSIKESGEIQEKGKFEEVTFEGFVLENLKSILSKTICDISRNVEDKISSHIKQHKMKDTEWIEKGITYTTTDSCPFCNQSISNSDILEIYEDYFNKEYMELKKSISSYKINEHFSTEQFLKNDLLEEFWNKYSKERLDCSLDTEQLKKIYDNSVRTIQSLITKKKENPLDEVHISDGERGVVQQLIDEIQQYNDTLKGYNKIIDEIKRSSSEGDISQVEKELQFAKCKKTRLEKDEFCKEKILPLIEEKRSNDEDQSSKKEELEIHSCRVLEKYQGSMNEFLKNFGANFSISLKKLQYFGYKPGYGYSIIIDKDENNEIRVQGSGVDTNKCLGNTLSEGDKATLAFAFFMAKLKSDEGLSEKIVVIDDPISSLDMHRKCQTIQAIDRLSSKVKQMFVMSHDAYFLKDIFNKCKKEDRKSLKIIRGGNSSELVECDIHEITQSSYMKDFNTLRNYLEGDKPKNTDLVAISIRSYLEGLLRGLFPENFVENETLGEYLTVIGGNKTHSLQKVYGELNDLNDFSSKYHHNRGEGQLILQDTTLKPYVERTLGIRSKMLSKDEA